MLEQQREAAKQRFLQGLRESTLREARQWAKNKDLSPVPLCGESLAVGDVVTFTNDYGVSFEGNTVIGFSCPIYPNSGTVYLGNSSYWFPNHSHQLTKEA